MCKWSARFRKGSSEESPAEENMIDQHLVELQLLNSAAVVDGARMNGGSARASGELSTTKSNGHPVAAVDDGSAKTNGGSARAFGELSTITSNGDTAAAVDDGAPKMNGGSARASRELSTTESKGHPAAVVDDGAAKVNGAFGEKSIAKSEVDVRAAKGNGDVGGETKTESIGHPEAPSGGKEMATVEMAKKNNRRGNSNVDQLSKIKYSRRPSDIDSLSPEVVRALQSTFGGKLKEIRSRIQATAPSPPSTPSPPRVPTPLPSPPKTPPPSSPPRTSPWPPPSSPVAPEKGTFVERLADTEGAYMLVAYFSAIFLSGFIFLATEDEDARESEEDHCTTLGSEERCVRRFGYVLPVLATAIFFTFALLFFVFDVSFSLFNVLTVAKGFLSETKKTTCKLLSKREEEDGRNAWTRLSGAGLVQLFVIDLGFIVVSSALLWISKISTVEPLQTICQWRVLLLWMVGLMVMDVVILISAVKSFSDPRISVNCIHTAAKRVFIIFCVLLACTAAIYQDVAPDSKDLRHCARRTPLENQLQMYESFSTEMLAPNCASKEGPGLLQCDQSRETVRRLDWCEAHQQCDWPLLKQIQLYERKDVCGVEYPQCDWPLMKQIQPYEDKGRCVAGDLVKCEWPWVKQIQVYEHGERCEPLDFTRQQCDWPLLKQLQLFEAQDRCPLKNPNECEWAWVKQTQLFDSKDFSSPISCRSRQSRNCTL